MATEKLLLDYLFQPDNLDRGGKRLQIGLTLSAIAWLLVTVAVNPHPQVEKLGIDLRTYQLQILAGYMFSWLCLFSGRVSELVLSQGFLLYGFWGMTNWLGVFRQLEALSGIDDCWNYAWLHGCNVPSGFLNLGLHFLVQFMGLANLTERGIHFWTNPKTN